MSINNKEHQQLCLHKIELRNITLLKNGNESSNEEGKKSGN